jgi:hypothetical protein
MIFYLAGPITGLGKHDAHAPGPGTIEGDHLSVEGDLREIDVADAVILNTEGTEFTSLGTAAEMGYAYGKKPIIGVGTCPDHAFFKYMVSEWVPDLEATVELIDIWGEELRKLDATAVPYAPPLPKLTTPEGRTVQAVVADTESPPFPFDDPR